MRGYDYITVREESVRGNEHLVDDALGMTFGEDLCCES